uniref:Uncharacterized protein n=1 Tax=Cucumis sativus TaxID=3659 RepID=A0A0A0LV64_CUCSA
MKNLLQKSIALAKNEQEHTAETPYLSPSRDPISLAHQLKGASMKNKRRWRSCGSRRRNIDGSSTGDEVSDESAEYFFSHESRQSCGINKALKNLSFDTTAFWWKGRDLPL